MKYFIAVVCCLWAPTAFSQTVQDLFGQEKYREAIALSENEEGLTKEDFYFIGRSYFMLEVDTKAIAFFEDNPPLCPIFLYGDKQRVRLRLRFLEGLAFGLAFTNGLVHYSRYLCRLISTSSGIDSAF